MASLGVCCRRRGASSLRLAAATPSPSTSIITTASFAASTHHARHTRCLQTSTMAAANPLTHPTVPGPPPKAPVPSTSFAEERISKKKRQLELLKKSQDAKSTFGLGKKRFWKDVIIEDTPEGYQILLDKRPVRKADKSILTIPHSKPQLATAIALEWDSLVMAQQALKQQYIPLTSLTSRAHDIAESDAIYAKDTSKGNPTRDSLVAMLMGYLRTDTLLCWAPEKTKSQNFGSTPQQSRSSSDKSLRQLQEEAAKPIVAHLTSCVWPGVELLPALEDGSIVPRHQPTTTQAVVRGWLAGLPSWELAGLERAVLASKSLCVGARLVVEWSGAFRGARQTWHKGETNLLEDEAAGAAGPRFAVEDAALACTQEVAYQTRMWGEVEDTHDVDREDVRRQLGSAVLLVHDS